MDRGRPELATYTSHLLPGWLRRFAGENFDALLCNIEIIGIQPVQMLLELLRSHGRAHILAAPEQIEIGRAHVCTPVTNAHLVCRLLLAINKKNMQTFNKKI